MKHKLIIDGNAVYEIDDDCLACRPGAEQREAEYEAERKKSKGEISCPPHKKNVKSKEK